MHFDIKSNINSKKQKQKKPCFGSHWGFILESQFFLEILKLKSPYKIASSLSNDITFLKKM